MKKVTTIFISVLLISCNNSNSVPAQIIKPAEMQAIFWDMIRGNILAQELAKKDSSQILETTQNTITKKILAIHKIDYTKFEKSIKFYEKHPILMRTIFDSLNAVQTRNYSKTKENEMTRKYGRDYHLSPAKKIP